MVPVVDTLAQEKNIQFKMLTFSRNRRTLSTCLINMTDFLFSLGIVIDEIKHSFYQDREAILF